MPEYVQTYIQNVAGHIFTGKENQMNKLFRFLLLTVFIPPWLFSCGAGRVTGQSLQQSAAHSMIEPGDTLSTMIITTGADDAPPLWAFCSSSPEGKSSYMLDCHVPVLASLGITNIFSSTNEATANLDGSDLVWNLWIDGQKVNLDSFGRIDYAVPSMSKSPSQIREIMMKGTAWNIVLTDLVPGHHTLWFVAQGSSETYTWFVSLEIEPLTQRNTPSLTLQL
jgi:hypothetical protein